MYGQFVDCNNSWQHLMECSRHSFNLFHIFFCCSDGVWGSRDWVWVVWIFIGSMSSWFYCGFILTWWNTNWPMDFMALHKGNKSNDFDINWHWYFACVPHHFSSSVQLCLFCLTKCYIIFKHRSHTIGQWRRISQCCINNKKATIT